MARMLTAMGQPDAARVYIRRVRQLGRFGQTAALADTLERTLDEAQPVRRPASQTDAKRDH
jgi:hypothetical protein